MRGDVNNPPVRLLRPEPRPEARQTLLCFSFCGGGTSRLRPWAAAVPADTELALFCYPGREARFTEPYADSWAALVDDALAEVRALDRPYLLFGHSMGARVAFDVALRAGQEGLPPPRALVASAADAPCHWAARPDRPPRPHDTDEELLRWMTQVGQLPAAVLAEPDLRAIAVEVLRADLGLFASYRYPPGARVDAPVEALYGAADPDVDRAAALRWQEVTTGPCEVRELPGRHFYTDEVWARLPRYISALHSADTPAADAGGPA